jgi:two-component system CheB/CheR fusion protein
MYKTSDLLQHIAYRMLATMTPTMQDYLGYLTAVSAEAEELVKALLVTYTHFFRDPDVFAYLKGTLLPELLARAQDRGRTLRFWAAGCATGEEAYSLAMLLADLLDAAFSEWHIKIFATDLSEAAIAFARRGVYTENSLTGLPLEYRARFFERVDHGYRIARILRQRVVFGQLDLSRSIPFPEIDLILCRNVLSYFTPDVQQQVLNQFAFSLYPAGYLLLGKAEAVRPPQRLYEPVSRDWNVYRCVGKGEPSAQFPEVFAFKMPRFHGRSSQPPPSIAAKQPIGQQVALPAFEVGQLRGFNELLFRSLPIGILVIDRSYRIVTANGISRQLLRLSATASEQDFFHAVPGIPYREVRTAIDAVFRQRNAITLPEVELDVMAGGTGRFVALSISPIQLDAAPPELAAISVINITEQVLVQRRLEAIQAEQAELVDQLGATNKHLNEVNTALMKVNEELRATNEDMLMTQEELQAKLEELELTNEELQANFEELETSDEALQAAKEEMETTNEAIQATNEALETTNADLHARIGELQAQNDLLVEERRRLAEIIECAPYSILVLRGPDLRVESFNERSAGGLQGQDVLGRPFSEVAGRFWKCDLPLVSLANEVYQHDAPRSLADGSAHVPGVPGETGTMTVVYTLMPAHGADGTVSGVIIHVTDEAEEREQAAHSEVQSDGVLP